MRAQVGDQLHFYSRLLDQSDRIATVIEVRGAAGEPPYLVRFVDGSERLVFPGSDCMLIPQQG
jgi:Domain of unknown function (DUF1918)